MRNWMLALAGLGMLLLTQVLHIPEAVSAAAGDARFVGVEASDTAVWVVDTHSGQVRRCTQDFADDRPRCSAFSRD